MLGRLVVVYDLIELAQFERGRIFRIVNADRESCISSGLVCHRLIQESLNLVFFPSNADRLVPNVRLGLIRIKNDVEPLASVP
jgi:hypothetical protein